jgi:16S rRNA (uracil1498-N3)-methyltransferase
MSYFFQPDILNGINHLNQEESKHCIRVLRYKNGDIIQVLDGKGGKYSCELLNTDANATLFRIIEREKADLRSSLLHLAISPTKNSERIEWLIEKTVEIGIERITFLICEHSERRKINLDRIRKKAVSALKQSGNLFLPEIVEMIPFQDFIKKESETNLKFICNAQQGKGNFLKDHIIPNNSCTVMVGPEGDFSQQEITNAIKSGFLPVSLGNSRFRTETAGLVVCIQLQLINL